MGAWDSPPTQDEVSGSIWNVPPTEAELSPVKSHTWQQSLGRGVLAGGTGGFIDELGGLVGKFLVGDGAVKLGANAAPQEGDSPEVRAAKLQLAQQVESAPTGYQLTRDTIQDDLEKARQANSEAFTTGELGGAVASSFLPGFNVAKGATLAKTMAALGRQGAAAGLGNSEADLTRGEYGRAALDTALGGAVGAGAGGLGHVLGKAMDAAARYGTDKVTALRQTVRQASQAQAAETTASARSLAGRTAQDAYKQLEHLRETGAIRSLSPEQAAVAKRLTEELGGKAADKLLPSAAAKDAAQQFFADTAAGEASLAEKLMAEKLGAGELKRQVGARFKRYVLPAVGGSVLAGATGNDSAAGLLGGAGVGALVGAGYRPMMQSLLRMAKEPVVQNALWRSLSVLGDAGASVAPQSVRAAVPISGGFAERLQPLLAELLGQDDRGQLAEALRRR